jgi:hypothetical protein
VAEKAWKSWFNREGKFDPAVLDQTRNSVSVLLGKGDGTFQARQAYAVGQLPVAVTAGDSNVDEKPDLAVAERSDNSVSILLGNNYSLFAGQVALVSPPGRFSERH